MTADGTYPGVYLETTGDGGMAPIAGVPTSITAFIGATATGELSVPAQVGSFAEFEEKFGALAAACELGYSVLQFFRNGGTSAWVVRVSDSPTDVEWIGAINALDSVDLFNLLVLPGVTVPSVVIPALEYCVKRHAFLILDPPKEANTPEQIVEWIETEASLRSLNAAVYFPWINIADPLNPTLPRQSAPGGTLAGLYARTDSTRGVWEAAAGIEANLVGVETLEYAVTGDESHKLASLGINVLRVIAPHGPVAWGARTLSGTDDFVLDWKYIPVRRLGLFLEESIGRGTRWATFEANEEPLWARIRLIVGAFMNDLFLKDAFLGATPENAYFVSCDQTTTGPEDIEDGIMNIRIGFAAIRPAEFVIITIQQIVG
jgi:phage tail sheath protein FI